MIAIVIIVVVDVIDAIAVVVVALVSVVVFVCNDDSLTVPKMDVGTSGITGNAV